MTAIEAALRGGRASLARALVAERLANKPHSPLALRYAVRERRTAGDAAGAVTAERQAESVSTGVRNAMRRAA